jgi:DNA-binding transcriptional regulator YiaG
MSQMSIKEAREQLGLSRAEMSRLFEIPVRTLEEWDAGRRTPPPYVEKLIVEKLQTMKKERG